jgi:hypothetical protein
MRFQGTSKYALDSADFMYFPSHYPHPKWKEDDVSNPFESSSQERAMPSDSRAYSALVGIYEISKVLTRPARIEAARQSHQSSGRLPGHASWADRPAG